MPVVLRNSIASSHTSGEKYKKQSCKVASLDDMHLSVFTPSRIALTGSARETVSLPRLGTLSTRFYYSPARDCTTFTLHDLTDFYIERVTVQRIKINDYSCFHKRWTNSKTNLKLKHL